MVIVTAVGTIVVQDGVTENTVGLAVENADVIVRVPVSQIVPICPVVVCWVMVPEVFWTTAVKLSVVEQLCGVA